MGKKNLKLNNGTYYGEVNRANQPNGNGHMKYNDGYTYEGDWVKGERSGQGILSKGKTYYNGQWKNDKCNGRGTMDTVSFHYEGDWVDNEMQGIGLCKYSDGSTYEGGFNFSKRHGYGKMYYSSGYYYEGYWFYDCRDGHGKLYYGYALIYEGEFKDDKYNGKGKLYYDNGKLKYDGIFYLGRYNGAGKLYGVNGSLSKCGIFELGKCVEHISEQQYSILTSTSNSSKETTTTSHYQEHLEASKNGDLKAKYELAVDYEEGRGILKDLDKALILLQELAKLRYYDAVIRLSQFYGGVHPLLKDTGKQTYYRRLAIEIAENLQSNNNQQSNSCKKSHVSKQLDNSEDLYKKAQKLIYRGSNEEYLEAINLLIESANLGNIDAQYDIGYRLYKGNGIEQDYNKAFNWLLRAANQGHVLAKYYLATCYHYGKGTPIDLKLAKKYYSEIPSGYLLPHDARIKIKEIEEKEDNVPVVFEYSEFDNNTSNITETIVSTPVTFEYSKCDDNNHENSDSLKNSKLYNLANNGDISAMLELAHEYRRLGLNYYTLAFSFYSKASEKGSSEGTYWVGVCYRDGIGVDVDYAKAKDKFLFAHIDGYKSAYSEYEKLLNSGWKVESQTEKNTTKDRFKVKIKSKGAEQSMKILEHVNEYIDSYFVNVIGMDSVKEQLVAIYTSIKLSEERKRLSTDTSSISDTMGYNFIITGNPGTGKTVVARIIGKILYDIGIRVSDAFVETDRQGLVGEHIGQTAPKTIEKCEAAYGGVLFVDEAYTLYKEHTVNDFGTEVIDTLLKYMEDNRDNITVILAGYEKEINEMINNANPGLRSRFTFVIKIPDYTTTELIQIAKVMAGKNGMTIDNDAIPTLERLINQIRINSDFGNARAMRTLIEKAKIQHDLRVSKKQMRTRYDLCTLIEGDFDDSSKRKNVSYYISKLDSMIGLIGAKSSIKRVKAVIALEQKRGSDSKVRVPNMMFLGNPGTGKTTVARLYGSILYSLGVIASNNFVECSRVDLVGQYMGHSAMKTKNIVKSALGGVLFIDEAYSLVEGNHDEFGREALDTLLKCIEDNRDNLVVIIAGYEDRIIKFLDNNPGMASRIAQKVTFADYTADEMLSILETELNAREYTLTDVAKQKALDILETKVGDSDFGNARGIRNLVDNYITNYAVRCDIEEIENPDFKIDEVDIY